MDRVQGWALANLRCPVDKVKHNARAALGAVAGARAKNDKGLEALVDTVLATPWEHKEKLVALAVLADRVGVARARLVEKCPNVAAILLDMIRSANTAFSEYFIFSPMH